METKRARSSGNSNAIPVTIESNTFGTNKFDLSYKRYHIVDTAMYMCTCEPSLFLSLFHSITLSLAQSLARSLSVSPSRLHNNHSIGGGFLFYSSSHREPSMFAFSISYVCAPIPLMLLIMRLYYLYTCIGVYPRHGFIASVENYV